MDPPHPKNGNLKITESYIKTMERETVKNSIHRQIATQKCYPGGVFQKF